MRRSAAGLFLLTALAIALAACSGSDKNVEADPNVFPTDYKAEILPTLTNLLGDPTNVHDAAISDPALRPVGKDQRYTACVRTNSRDASRHYEGVKERLAYFYGGHLNQLVEAKDGECANVAYKPWPELAAYCLSKSCS